LFIVNKSNYVDDIGTIHCKATKKENEFYNSLQVFVTKVPVAGGGGPVNAMNFIIIKIICSETTQ